LVFDRLEEGMTQRRVTPRTILTNAEVSQVVHGIRNVFGERFAALAASYGLDLEEGVRFMPVAKRCEERRAAQNWAIRDVAKALRVPQYRLKDIESGHVRNVRPEILHAYVSHLGLTSWYRRWEHANPGIARRVGLPKVDPPRIRSGRAVEQMDAADEVRATVRRRRGPRS
jgi:transcriptional regulator with XRE-family HTH domain